MVILPVLYSAVTTALANSSLEHRQTQKTVSAQVHGGVPEGREVKLLADDGIWFAQFGYAVELSEGHLMIGASNDHDMVNFHGSVYVFELSGGEWAQIQKLEPSDVDVTQAFGCSISRSGNFVLIGACADAVNGEGAGAVYVFELLNGTWVE